VFINQIQRCFSYPYAKISLLLSQLDGNKLKHMPFYLGTVYFLVYAPGREHGCARIVGYY